MNLPITLPFNASIQYQLVVFIICQPEIFKSESWYMFRVFVRDRNLIILMRNFCNNDYHMYCNSLLMTAVSQELWPFSHTSTCLAHFSLCNRIGSHVTPPAVKFWIVCSQKIFTDIKLY